MEEVVEVKERHPFRFMFKFAVFVGILFVVSRLLDEKRKEFSNLTESQAREKFVSKTSDKLGEEQANEIADQVIPKLKERGIIKPDPVEEVAEEAKDEVADAVDSVVNED